MNKYERKDSFKKYGFRIVRNVLDINLQKNSFGGWHIDAGTEQNNSYLSKDNYKFVKCGMLLQDNTKEYGGFVDVIPKSHKYHRTRVMGKSPLKIIKQIYASVIIPIKMKFFALMVPAKAGDLVFFDSRLYHQATKPNSVKNYKGLPKNKTKYMFYWDACHNDMTQDFLNHSQKRAILENKDELFFTRYLSNYYPDDYPKKFIKGTEESNINIASLDRYKSKIFKKILQDYIA